MDWLLYPSVYRVEWYLLLGLGIAALLLPGRLRIYRAIGQWFSRLAANRRMAVLAVVAAVMIGRAVILPLSPIPHPGIADEFGYLLTADTFLHGRLTNPTSPMWVHFETFHAFHVPTYQSQYPIGYPVVLALAWKITGEPWWGVFVTTALMCGALTWMLQAWLPPRWALFGGLLVAARVGLFSYWMNSFWGGSLAALGGCLFFGAVPRLVKGIGRRDIERLSPMLYFSVGAVGLALLVHTRPFEGFLLTLPGMLLVFWSLVKGYKPLTLARVMVSGLLILLAAFAAMLIYQKAVTGHALESPYTVASRQYHVSRPFFFQSPLPIPKYRHSEFRFIYVQFETKNPERMTYLWGFLDSMSERLQDYWKFFIGPLLTIPLLFSILRFGAKRLRFVLFSLLLLGSGAFLESWIQVHYLAPAYCLFVLLLLEGIRKLRSIKIKGLRVGQKLAVVLPIVCVVMIAARALAIDERQHEYLRRWPPNWAFSTMRLWRRDRLETRLENMHGKSLVIVRYRGGFHSPHEEWVYNGADLKNGKVLWARSMSAEENCELVRYYQGRAFWVVDNWGSVENIRTEDESQICDPKNVIYEVNRPITDYGDARRLLELPRVYLRPRQTY